MPHPSARRDDLLAGGNRLDRRVVEVLRRRSDRHGGDFALDVIDRVGAPFGFLSEVQPFGDFAGSHIRHARFDPQVDGFGLALAGNRSPVEGIHGDLEVGGRIGKRRPRDAFSRNASAVGERLGPVLCARRVVAELVGLFAPVFVVLQRGKDARMHLFAGPLDHQIVGNLTNHVMRKFERIRRGAVGPDQQFGPVERGQGALQHGFR